MGCRSLESVERGVVVCGVVAISSLSLSLSLSLSRSACLYPSLSALPASSVHLFLSLSSSFFVPLESTLIHTFIEQLLCGCHLAAAGAWGLMVGAEVPPQVSKPQFPHL